MREEDEKVMDGLNAEFPENCKIWKMDDQGNLFPQGSFGPSPDDESETDSDSGSESESLQQQQERLREKTECDYCREQYLFKIAYASKRYKLCSSCIPSMGGLIRRDIHEYIKSLMSK